MTDFEQIRRRARRRRPDDHAEPARAAERVHRDDAARADRGVRPRRRRRRRPRGDRHRRGPRLLRRRRPRRRAATTFDWREREAADGWDVPRDGGGQVVAAHLRLHEAGDRRDQRAGRRRGHHDDAADGHPAGGRAARRSASSSPAAASCRRRARAGSCRGIVGISQAMEWVATGPRLRRAGGAGRRARAQRPRAGRAAARPRTRSPREIADNTAPGVGRARPPAAVADARRRRTRWPPTAPTRGRCSRAASPRTPREGVTVVPREAPGGVPRPRLRRPA